MRCSEDFESAEISGTAGFQIEEETKAAIRRQARFLRDISAERIRVELDKLLVSDHPEVLADAYKLE